jgi:hypothetical protein
MTVYLSGPMTGLPEFNHPFFAETAAALRGAGYTVVSPHELAGPGLTWEEYMRIDLRALLDGPEAIVMLPGWEASRGARIELETAKAIGLDVLTWPLAAKV